MVDWNSLKPLRFHRNIMTFIIILLIGLFFIPTHSLSPYKPKDLQYKVIAKSGLKIRTEPNVNSSVLTTIPYNTEILIVKENEFSDVVNGQLGNWYLIEYNNLQGYAWSKFVAKN